MESKILLKNLSPYRKETILIKKNQSVSDIISAIKTAHSQYKSEYKKIALYFLGSSQRQTAKNIWNYLKKNVPYKAEPDHFQTIKSPAAIIATGMNGTLDNDCKNYALFTAGVLDALNSMGYKYPFAFRFASYNFFDKTPGHVFVVLNPGTNNEIWIDPVLPTFDNRKQYDHAKDEKMSMYSISGIGQTKKQKRQQKRADRKAAGKTLGQKLKKVGRGVLKVGAAVPRNSFLVLVKLNVRSLATNLKKVQAKEAGKLTNFWEGLGGNVNALNKAIEIGSKKKRLGTVGEPITVSAAVASAAPILVKVVDFLNKAGITKEDLQGIQQMATNALRNKINETISKQEEQAIQQEIQNEPEATEPEASGMDMKKILPIVLIGGAGLYFLTRKK
jgi:hypothetical protein